MRKTKEQRDEWESLKEIARGNLANAEYDPESDSADHIHEEVYSLAFDALIDKGTDPVLAAKIANELAGEHANP
jgi:hypothetical protein